MERDDNQVASKIKAGHRLRSSAFTTRNRNQPDERIEMRIVEGPFETFEGS